MMMLAFIVLALVAARFYTTTRRPTLNVPQFSEQLERYSGPMMVWCYQRRVPLLAKLQRLCKVINGTLH